jgi:hypothetical protein
MMPELQFAEIDSGFAFWIRNLSQFKNLNAKCRKVVYRRRILNAGAFERPHNEDLS